MKAFRNKLLALAMLILVLPAGTARAQKSSMIGLILFR